MSKGETVQEDGLKKGQSCYDDEIDLYEVWFVLKKRKKVVLLTLFVFLAVAIVYILVAKPVYRLEHHFTEPISENLPAQVQKGITTLNFYLEMEEYDRVAELLSLSPGMVEFLAQVSFLGDRENKDIFSISIDAYNPKFLHQFDRAVVKYLKNLPAISEAVELRRKSLTRKLAFYRSRLKDAMAFAEGIKEKLLSGGLKVIGFNPLDVESTIIKYQNEVISLELALEKLAPFKDIVVAVSDEPVKPKKLLVIVISLFSGLFVGIFLAFFLEWLEKSKKREEA